MSSMVQIRNVPDAVHRELKARAALAGLSLSDFILREMKRNLERPTREELLRRLARRTPVPVHPAPADVVRQERERR
jgi:plasmid stability protein